MQAVILAAGKSTRTYPLTVHRPKVLLPLLDSTIIEHNLEQLTGLVKEVILVVGFKKEEIMKKLGTKYKDIPIRYVEQKEQKGTGHALLLSQKLIKGRFIMLYGDDLYSGDDLKRCIKHPYAILTKKVPDPERFGILKVRGKRVIGIVEKPKEFVSDLINGGGFVMDKKLFSTKLQPTERGEYEATDLVTAFCKKNTVEYELVKDYYLPVGYPWHLLEANVLMLHRANNNERLGTVEEGAVVKGIVHLGKGSVIKSGSYIEGPVWIGDNCTIGPHAFLRPDTIILDNCRIRAEVFDALIMKDTTAKHQSYIAHSVIGEGCNIGCGTITADYRHDGKANMTVIHDKKIDSGRRKLGAFLGDGVKTGIGTLIYPGRKLWPNATTLPGEIVTTDKLVQKGSVG
jgi:UDP-N-acetylglucosamine diphosphorylase / glucose-1-phosphate thymidylyltransferase / UDP-N-acetylgalactosamine diphosphorylase / glucosamine-1-phosphate N-acetyltransferase / galactosamine-1-phosphate N-acetyltransferase